MPKNSLEALPLRVNACPVCGHIPADGSRVWVVDFVVTHPDPEEDCEEHFDSAAEAEAEAARLGVPVALDLSDGCRTTDLKAVPFTP